jgi:hypothetical protein
MSPKHFRAWIALAALAMAVGVAQLAGCASGVPGITAHARDLNAGRAAVQARLDALHRDLDTAERALNQPADLGGAYAQSLVNALVQNHPHVVFCATTNLRDVAVAVAPAEGPLRPGDTLVARDRFNPKTSEGEPLLSYGFPPPETPGALFCDIVFPVADAGGRIFGGLRVRINATDLVGAELEPIVQHGRATFWTLQSDGVTLYDPDDIEIGRNVFTDMIYTPFEGLNEVARRIVNAPTGYGQYKFLSTGMGAATRKFCNWDTVSLYRTEWRIVLVREAL